jgi:hypothetical protein
MTPRENIPSFLTFASIPKTQSEIYECVRNKDLFLALVPIDTDDVFTTEPVLVFYCEKHVYWDSFLSSCIEEAQDNAVIHGIDLTPEMNPVFICEQLTNAGDIMYPLPDHMVKLVYNHVWSWDKKESDGDNLVPFARKALELRRDLIARTIVED